jgi:hypothetical protein
MLRRLLSRALLGAEEHRLAGRKLFPLGVGKSTVKLVKSEVTEQSSAERHIRDTIKWAI